MTGPLRGGCFCGAVRFEADEVFDSGYCHCSVCRRFGGSPAVLWANTPARSFRLTSGQAEGFASSERWARYFCARCGSPVYGRHPSPPADGSDLVCFALPSLDDPLAVRPGVHTWCRSALPYFETGDDLPRFPEGELPHPNERGGVADPREQVGRLLARREGHFVLESGHHGELWLDLELLALDPERLRPLSRELALRLLPLEVSAVCGALVEGAFVALQVAEALGVHFAYTQPAAPRSEGLFPVEYALPQALRPRLRGARVAVVNDVVNAGSAVRGTLAALREAGAEPVAIATLAVLGDAAGALAAAEGVVLETLAGFPNRIFLPDDCPLCRRGVPLAEDVSCS